MARKGKKEKKEATQVPLPESAPDVRGSRSRPGYKELLLVLLLLAGAGGLMAHSALFSMKGPTHDEPGHLAAGSAYLNRGAFNVLPTDPPLIKQILAAPLIGAIPAHPKITPADGAEFLYGAPKQKTPPDHETLLRLGRLAGMGLALLLLIAIWLVARRLHGPAGGLVSLALAAASPTLLAHGRLATLDTGASLFIFLATMATIGMFRRGRWWRVLLAAVALGLALASVRTAPLILGPFLTIAMLAPRLGLGATPKILTRLGRWLTIVLVAVLVLWGTYQGQLPEVTVQAGDGSAWQGRFPLHHYIQGMMFHLDQCRGGHANYLLGAISSDGFGLYFLIALAVKVPIAGLLAWLGGLGITLKTHWREAVLLLLVPITLIAYQSLVSKAQLGIRHILPAFPFLFVLAGALGPALAKAGRKRWRKAVLAIIIIGQFAATGMIHPHYLMHFNQAVGGADGGPAIMVMGDDAGQDMPGLAAYLTYRGTTELAYAPYGTARPEAYGIPEFSRLECGVPTTGVVAIHIAELKRPMGRAGDCYAWLSGHEPVARVGHTIYVYDIPAAK